MNKFNFVNMPQSGNVEMQNVAAQSTVKLCAGIPWTNNYNHVRLFDSKSDLYSYVDSKAVHTINNCAPVKMGRLRIKVAYNEMEAMKCNYCMIQNNPYDSTWYYYFITKTEWASNSSTWITIEYDVFQNTFYDLTIKQGFVERMHIAKSDDTIGANIVPDSLPKAEAIAYDKYHIGYGGSYIGLLVTELPSGSPATEFNRMRNNVYSGLIYAYYPASDYETVNNLLTEYQNAPDAVIAITMIPGLCVEDTTTDLNIPCKSSYDFGFTPKNNKLYTYPYSYILADNNYGTTENYKWEYLNLNSSGNARFQGIGFGYPYPFVVTRPIYYRQVTSIGNDYEYAIVTSNFPICSWASDVFKAWWAQNKNAVTIGAFGDAVNSLVSGLSFNFQGMTQGITNIQQTAGHMLDLMNVPHQAHGKSTADGFALAVERNETSYFCMGPTPEMARIIDDYWTAYGYPINEITTPLLKSRSSWNYVKMSDCGFTGNVELEYLQGIRDIFNNGVTLWHTNDIGNYGLSNN